MFIGRLQELKELTDDLALMMNKELNKKTQKKLENLLSENFIHKLTYRKNWRPEIKGKKTVYSIF